MFYYQLRNELWKLFGKKRTYIGFAMCLLAQAVIILLFRYTHGPRRDMVHRLELMGYASEKFITNLTMATAVLVPVAFVLLPLYVSLVGGDLMAKEAEDGTLRMILARPISRLRLVTTKWLAGAIFSCVAGAHHGKFRDFFRVVILSFWRTVCAAADGRDILGVWRGRGLAALRRRHADVERQGDHHHGLGVDVFLLQCQTGGGDDPGFVVRADQPDYSGDSVFSRLASWFITYHLELWMKMFHQPVPLPDVGQSLSILIGYNLTFFIIGCRIFQVRDIKS